jgi:hypothetical protein
VRVRGREVQAVYILDVWRRPQPVFHRWSEAVPGPDVVSACGRSIFPEGQLTIVLPARLAVKFARPCERCFPRETNSP